MRSLLAIVVASCLLSGCAGWGCDGWKKFRPDPKDTAGSKRQALEHNKFGARQGCWK